MTIQNTGDVPIFPALPPIFMFGNIWDVSEHGHLIMQRRWHKAYGPVVGFFFDISAALLISNTEFPKKSRSETPTTSNL